MNLQNIAHRKVRSAIQHGILNRPDICSRCGIRPKPASDGRAVIQAHHADYSKPLDVEWICSKCHRDDTPLPPRIGRPTPGEENGQAKLTDAKVREIRKLHFKGWSYVAIGKRFGINNTTARRAARGELWRHIEPNKMPTAQIEAAEGEGK